MSGWYGQHEMGRLVWRARAASDVALALMIAVAVGCGGGSHPVTGGNGGTSGNGGSGVACTLPPLAASTMRSWDVQVATVSGTITLAGAAWPASPDLPSRGAVMFTRDGALVGTLDLGPTGPASFSTTLFSGVYDIDLQTLNDPMLAGVPSGGRTRLASAVHLTGQQRLDYDLKLVSVASVVTVNGAAMPDSPGVTSRGTLTLTDQQSGLGYSFTIGATGPGTFAGTVVAGTYDLDLFSGGPNLVGLPEAGRPRLATGVAVQSPNGVAPSYNVQVASVSGLVTLNGGLLPNVNVLDQSRGYVTFVDRVTQTEQRLATGYQGLATYAGLVFAGTYDITFRTPLTDMLNGLPKSRVIPLSTATVVSGTMTADYDLRSFKVTGRLTSNGGALPALPSTASPGAMAFISRTDASSTQCFVLPSDSTFSCTLFPGAYDVDFIAPFNGIAPEPLFSSATSTRVATDVEIEDAATLNYDLPVVTVSGTITSGGATLPDSPMVPYRATVIFRDRASGAPRYMTIGPTGPGTFSGDIFAGTYDITLSTSTNSALVGLPVSGRTSLASAVVISSTRSKTFAWDAPVISVGGTVTLGGAILPDSPGAPTRGTVIFHDKLTGAAYSLGLPGSGPGTASGTVFAGSYDVELDTHSLSNSGPLVGLPISAETDLEIGCVAPITCAAGLDAGDISGSWTLVFRDRGFWEDWSATLSQAGPDIITGRFSSPAAYRGPIGQGSRAGDNLRMFAAYPASYRVDATLAGGCLMMGRGFSPSMLSPLSRFPAASPFVGFR